MLEPSTSLSAAPNAEGEAITEMRAKQGRRGFHVLAVLIVSLILVVGAFGVILATHAHTPSDAAPAAVQANSRTMSGAGPAPR